MTQVNPVFNQTTHVLNLNAQDTRSGIRRTEVSEDGGASWYTSDASWIGQGNGSHVLQYRAYDKAGNGTSGEVTVVVVVVVPTPPLAASKIERLSQARDFAQNTQTRAFKI